MFVLCALRGALLVLCVVLSRACGTTYVSSYWLADGVKLADTNHTVSISAYTLCDSKSDPYVYVQSVTAQCLSIAIHHILVHMQ